jgi:mono/diheme cytochrome c family protein
MPGSRTLRNANAEDDKSGTIHISCRARNGDFGFRLIGLLLRDFGDPRRVISWFFRMKTLVAFVAFSAFAADIPRVWEQSAIDTLELPLAIRDFSPLHIGEDAYYRIPERVIYKSYPVYAPGRGPKGYAEWLRTVEPEVAFDPSRLTNQEQWTAAGEIVFKAPTSLNPVFFSAKNLRDPAFFERTGMPVARDGTIPFARWVVRRRGLVELGSMGCNTCHTRVLEDGTVVPGAQGNNPNDREGALLLRTSAKVIGTEKLLAQVRSFARQFELPWLPDDINRLTRSMNLDQLIAAGEAIPPGVTARANTSMLLPPQIPDLIGVRDRRFLDHTGLIRHRSIGDLMRYSSLAQDVFSSDRYGAANFESPPVPESRYSDAQLYALALYLYSLRPPPNPNAFSVSAKRGSVLFTREKCANCHTPPLYTNNQLIAADDFQPPADASDVLPVRIGVDPRYALQTHKGTGYYKVPSLRGVWCRGPFGHSGSAATLEDWFDPARLDPGYVPSGFKGYDGKTRSIPGHTFGLRLRLSERKDLIAFLRTL